MNEENTILIPHNGKNFRIYFSDELNDIDAEDVVTIHYNNIIAELIIFPVILQRIGNLLAIKKNQYSYAIAAMEYLEADLRREFRIANELPEEAEDEEEEDITSMKRKPAKVKRKPKNLTVKELDDMVVLDDRFADQKQKLIILESEVNKIEVLYWACKKKLDAIETISSKLSPEDFKMDLIKERLVKLNSYGCEVKKMGDFL